MMIERKQSVKIVIIIISLCFSSLLVTPVLADQKQVIKELEDYRMANYKAPVPMTVACRLINLVVTGFRRITLTMSGLPIIIKQLFLIRQVYP